MLEDIAIRLLTMATQSADVERTCKVHKLVHTKARNRLSNATVTQLVYCYVNLRLVKKMETEEKGKSFDADDDLEDFLYSSLTAAGDDVGGE